MEQISNEQIQSVQEMLASILGTDNQLRRVKEAEIQELRKNHPNEVVLCLLAILERSQEPSIRMLSSVLLRQFLTIFTMHDIHTWEKLGGETKQLVKVRMMACIQQEPHKIVRNRIADAIGEIAGTIFKLQEEWPELITYLLAAARSEIHVQSAHSLKILGVMATYCHAYLTNLTADLVGIFQVTLESTDPDVRLNSVEALTNLMSVIDGAYVEHYRPLLQKYLGAIVNIVQADEIDGKTALEHLTYVAEAEPKFLKKDVELLAQFVDHLFTLEACDITLRHMALEFFAVLLENTGDLLHERQAIANALITKTFAVMFSIDPEVEEGWNNPVESPEDQESDFVDLGRKLLSRYMHNCSAKDCLPHLLQHTHEALYNTTDWRQKYAGLMTLAEVGAWIRAENQIAEVFQIAQRHLDQTLHPKIRFAAYLLIAQLCEHKSAHLQASYHQEIGHVLLLGFGDPIPRVVGECMVAIHHFMSGLNKTLAIHYAATFTPKVIATIGPQNCSVIIEEALLALTATAQSCQEAFAQYYSQVIPLLLQITRGSTEAKFKTLRGKAVQCISEICAAVGVAVFRPNISEIVQTLIEVQNVNTDTTSQITDFILKAWSRLCKAMEDEFIPYLPHIIPGILSMCSVTAEASISTDPSTLIDLQSLMNEEKRTKVSVTTTDLQDKVNAIDTLIDIAKTMKHAFEPYIEQAKEILTPYVNYDINENVRASASGTLAVLVEATKNSSNPQAGELAVLRAREFLTLLWTAAGTEYDTYTLCSQLDNIKNIIKTIDGVFLSQEEINECGRRLVQFISSSLNKREKYAARGQMDSDEEQMYELDQSDADMLHTAISDVLGAIFQTHSAFSLQIVQYFYKEVLSRFLTTESSFEDKKFAVFVIDDILEYIQPADIMDMWPTLVEAVLGQAVCAGDQVRQAAVYGVGLIAMKSGPELFGPIAQRCIDVLVTAIEMPLQHSPLLHGHAHDNAVASLGKLIKSHYNAIDVPNVLPAWIRGFPLKYDKEEAVPMHKMLVEWFLSSPDLLMPYLEPIIFTFGSILETKFVDQETTAGIGRVIKQLQDAGVPQLSDIWSRLNENMQGKFANLLRSGTA